MAKLGVTNQTSQLRHSSATSHALSVHLFHSLISVQSRRRSQPQTQNHSAGGSSSSVGLAATHLPGLRVALRGALLCCRSKRWLTRTTAWTAAQNLWWCRQCIGRRPAGYCVEGEARCICAEGQHGRGALCLRRRAAWVEWAEHQFHHNMHHNPNMWIPLPTERRTLWPQ